MVIMLGSILQDLEQNLFLPSDLISTYRSEVDGLLYCKVKYDIVPDACMLKCGCIVSEQLMRRVERELGGGVQQDISCPICQCRGVSLVGPILPLRSLYHQLQFYRTNQTRELQDTGDRESVISTEITAKTGKQQSLLSLFHKAATKISNVPAVINHNKDIETLPSTAALPVGCNGGTPSVPTGALILDSASNAKTLSLQDHELNSVRSGVHPTISLSLQLPKSLLDEEREFYFAKCFPMYRKRMQFNTHPKFLKTKSKLFINTYISNDCARFALISETKWEVYNIRNTEEPELLCCGNVSGDYGPDFNNLKKPVDQKQVLYPKTNESSDSSTNLNQAALRNWEHLYCRLAKDVFVISGTKGYFRVFDLSQGGKPVFTYCSSFPIRCIDLDPSGSIISCGITGKDKTSDTEQALILFQHIERKSSVLQFSSQLTIALPYRDPINTLQFSSDGKYLSCSTALESRFLVISLRKSNEPRLVMKSLRSIDTSLESEGITATKMFPDNPNLMCVTSVAFNSPPIVINTKIETINGVQTVAQPTMLMRIDEVDSKIHNCEISPRSDAIAFVDRSGTVYLLFAPTMTENETRRIVTVDVVANAYRAREAACMRFSLDGHKLYLVDRKGILYVEDFAFALPQNHEVTKCKQIN
ncbi:Ptr3p Ecym_2327 [Eremothecium cymbalariae DBVPG|uniref:SPS-sensor component PTR3 n=1 Tax=Eremothecium cymbalariae (strain CBS 270.75 / DBVPG 7215 / KCTC 17166 / NRRL Y-17582) TaxID=931890 RepID=G8JQ64_ERECY|nr:Hypothetical protein Ecym_2327 [Eremothecium cymbalariae DBVPG\